MNLKNIAHILGISIFLIRAAMLPALAISLALHEPAWTPFGISALITMGTGLLLYVFIPRTGERITLTHREGFVIVTLAWVLASTFGGLPFLLSGVVPTFCDAFFETMSGFTTTESVRVGVGMISRGEVGLIIAGYGLEHGIISRNSSRLATFHRARISCWSGMSSTWRNTSR